MSKQVLYAGDQMKLGNTIKALADMIHLFEVFDQNVQGKGKFCATGVLSPLKIYNHPDDPHHNPNTEPHISEVCGSVPACGLRWKSARIRADLDARFF